jgi:hypothetical protein
MKFKNPFKRESKFPTATKHITKYAFTVDGVDYFEFDQVANLPYKRGLKFLSVYNELDMKCDRFYLNAYCDAIESQFNKPKLGFNELANIRTMTAQLKERLTWIYQEDLIYKLCSVVFFDANENPDDWEWGYALKKIEHWKKHESAAAFFLHEPIQRLIPYLKDLGLNSLSYSSTQKELDKQQLENLFRNLSGSQKKDLPSYTERYFSEEMKQNSV